MRIRHSCSLLQFPQRLTRYFLSIPRQENLEGPLDCARTGASDGFPAVIPGLCPFKVNMTAHKSTAVFRVILAVGCRSGTPYAFAVAAVRSRPPLRGRRRRGPLYHPT